MHVRYLCAACIAFIVVACHNDNPVDTHSGPQLTVAVHLSAQSVPAGDTVRYTLDARDANGQALAADGFTWRLSNSTLARFDDNEPLLVGVRKGTVSVTAIAKSDTTQRGSANLLVLDGAPAFDWTAPGYKWTEELAPGTWGRIWGSSAHDVYAASTVGIAHYNGLIWSLVRPFTRDSASHAVTGSGANDVYVGSNLGMYHFDGAAWSWVAIPDSASHMPGTIGDLWAAGPGDVFAKIDNQLWRYRGGQWQLIFSRATGAWGGLTGSSTTSVYMTDHYTGAVVRWNGAAWDSLASPPGMYVGALWASAADVYAAGGRLNNATGQWRSEVMRYRGGSWSALAGDSAAVLLRAVHGTSDNAIMAVGDNGVARYFDGTAFHTIWLGTRANLLDVWMDATDVFITTPDGRVLHGRRE